MPVTVDGVRTWAPASMLDAVGGPWWGNCAWDAVGIAAVTDPGAPVADQIVPAPGDRCRDLLGREAFSLFPDNPRDTAADGVAAVSPPAVDQGGGGPFHGDQSPPTWATCTAGW